MRWREITAAAVALAVVAGTALGGPAAPHGAAGAVISPDLHQILEIPEHGRTLQIMLVLLQLSAMLAAAKVMGWAATKIHVPGVVGELLAGAIIGPYLLGGMIRVPLHGMWIPLFPGPGPGEWPVNEIIWALAQVASIILLFMTGLHTDLRQFLRYVGPATLIAGAGVLAPFILGVGVVYLPPFASLAVGAGGGSVLIPALFVGAILAATSIGITARVLGDMDKLDSPEGVTILGAAVLDDVLGIIALAIVGGLASSGAISAAGVAGITGKAVGVWIALTAIAFAAARPAEKILARLAYPGAAVGVVLAMAFVCSAVAELFNLAFVIGAYSAGLGLSRTKMAQRLLDELRPLADFIVPVFFAALGMLVNFEAMFADWRVVMFGLAVTAAAIIGKVVGCGAAALPAGFNRRGAWRIGLGMLPRGEVALIVAGIGLSRRLIGPEVFGVSIMMTLLTTLLAPILLVGAFSRGGSGRLVPEQKRRKLPSASVTPALVVRTPDDLGAVFLDRLLKAATARGWELSYARADEGIFLLRNEDDAASVRREDGAIHVDASDVRQDEFVQMAREVRAGLQRDTQEMDRH